MGKHYEDKRAVCPFFLHYDTQVIYCEGVQEGCVTHIAFASKTDCKDYRIARCREEWEKCHIAQGLISTTTKRQK